MSAVLNPAPPPDLMRSSRNSSRRMWGLLKRKKRWSLSWQGRLLVILCGLTAVYFGFSRAYPFLAITKPVDTKVLVVEGWIQRYALQAAATEFNRGAYETVYTTGGPENGSGGYVNDYQTSASAGAEGLKKLGLPGAAVQMVPSHVIGRDRTYSAAMAFRDWLHDHQISVRRINVLTEDAHARRTRLLYQKALGRNVMVGIISVPNPDYNPKLWFRYSDGVREVIGESIAYIYAKFFFHPSELPADEKNAGASSPAAAKP